MVSSLIFVLCMYQTQEHPMFTKIKIYMLLIEFIVLVIWLLKIANFVTLNSSIAPTRMVKLIVLNTFWMLAKNRLGSKKKTFKTFFKNTKLVSLLQQVYWINFLLLHFSQGSGNERPFEQIEVVGHSPFSSFSSSKQSSFSSLQKFLSVSSEQRKHSNSCLYRVERKKMSLNIPAFGLKVKGPFSRFFKALL